jgi:lipoprotein NlpI
LPAFGDPIENAMRRFLIALFAAGAAFSSFGADTQDARLREALQIARTNISAAVALCDQIVADFPTNAQPLAVRARLLDRLHRYDDAIRDLSTALKLDSMNASLWQARGEVNFKSSRFKESVADFDRVIQMNPAQAPHHWQRGISLYYANRFTDGRKQFESHQSVNADDVENAVWHFLCTAKERGVTNARHSMIRVGPDARVPMAEIYALFNGSGSVEQVLSASKSAAGARQQSAPFYAHLYLGLYFDAFGDSGKAREHLGKAVNEFGSEHYMGDVARVHFRKLNATR